MPIVENDIELLESHLDGALDPPIQSLQQRLTTEAELAASLDGLRAQRLVRRQVWKSFEPADATVDRLNWRIQGAVAAEQRRRPMWNPWRIGRFGSAAACMLLGFFGGWIGRGGHFIGPVETSHTLSTGTGETPMATNNLPVQSVANPPAAPLYVPVTNEYGQVVAWQQFQNPNDAKDFTEDLHRANQLPVATPTDDKVRLMSAEEKSDKY